MAEFTSSQIKSMAKEVSEKVGDFFTEKTVSKESKLWGALSYLVIVLVPLAVILTERKNDKFVAFHAYQSLLLTGAAFAYCVVLAAAVFVAGLIVPLLALLLMLLYIAVPAAFVLMAWKAYKGKRYALPVLPVIRP